ncbi:MAG TPA: hypothetical protein VMY42_22610 [Thermoguttaceae bacterium]|nr:hypothetical protein [Thermoguttaceae bacterium]
MPLEPRPSRTLQDVAAVMDLRPLQPGDWRYVDICKGRRSPALKHLRVRLEDAAAAVDALGFVKLALTGHRGCGKSTELLRLEHELEPSFTALHLYADEQLLGDYDYTYLFLWLVDQLVQHFEERLKLPLHETLVADVVRWFAEVVTEHDETVRKEIGLTTEAEAGAKFNWFGLRLGLFAKLQSMIRGSHEKRTQIRNTLQRYSTDLVNKVNMLLDDAHERLASGNRPPQLLIVVDNLDRLKSDVSEPLFFQNGDLLSQLRAHVIYTVPVAIALSPRNIRNVFPFTYNLPMVRVHNKQNRPERAGLGALAEMIAGRVEIGELFTSTKVVRHLAKMSGGSVRDLMRLVAYAANSARADGKPKIDTAAANEAVADMRLDYERLLVPGQIYYPLLAKIHQTKRDWFADVGQLNTQQLAVYREVFAGLLFNGAVLEYDGGENWYDVHPAIQEIETFREALANGES